MATPAFNPNQGYDLPAFDPNAAYNAAEESAPAKPQPESALSRFGHSFLSGLGVTSNEDAKNFFEHPINTALNSLNAQGELAKKAKDAYDRGDYKSAVIHGLNYLVPFIGQQTDKAGEQLSQGDIAGGVGRTLGVAAPIIAGSPEAQSAASDAATAAAGKSAAGVRAAARGANKVLAKAPGTIGMTAGAAAGRGLEHVTGVPGLAEVGAAAGYGIGKEVLPAVRIPGEGFGLPSRVTGGPEVAPKFEPGEPAAAAPAAPAPKITPKAVEQQLEEALGGKKLVPGVSLKNQPAAQAAAAGKLPEGFTPVESSALKGYKYDPAAREFEYITKDGSHYVRGDVEPEAAAQFEQTAAEKGSFGKAWAELRQNPQGGVGVAKVINGKRVPVIKTAPITDLAQQIKDSAEPSQAPSGAPLTDLAKQIKKSAKRSVVTDPATGKPEFSDVVAKKSAAPAAKPAPEEDLTELLQKSVEQAKAQKAASASTVEEIPDNVMTMRDPAELAKRWGVDAESLAAGREQTRGMSPQETEAQIAKLAARYKKGFPVEPVLETRDAANNIVAVDGRARAIAAQRAGVKQVPIIVRRLKTAAEAPTQ